MKEKEYKKLINRITNLSGLIKPNNPANDALFQRIKELMEQAIEIKKQMSYD